MNDDVYFYSKRIDNLARGPAGGPRGNRGVLVGCWGRPAYL